MVMVGASCSGDDGGNESSGDFSVAELLAEIPEPTLDDGYTLTASDIDRAAELANAERPSDDADVDEILDWALAISGVRADEGEGNPVAVLFPQAVNETRLAQIDEFRDELGWSLLQVSSFIELNLPPVRFTAMEGSFDTDEIDDALGEADDGIWSVGGEDFETDVANVSATRPLGESLRLAENDGVLAVSRSTPPIEEWVEDDNDTVAEDDAIVAVAKALDDSEVYTAMILDGDTLSIGGAATTPEQLEQLEETALQPFDVLGAGLSVDDDGNAIATFVYHHDDEDTAEENAARLEDLIEDGASLINQQPLSERFDLVDVTVDGTTVTMTLQLADDALARQVFSMVFAQDIIATHL
jgi:hypothetical protein